MHRHSTFNISEKQSSMLDNLNDKRTIISFVNECNIMHKKYQLIEFKNQKQIMTFLNRASNLKNLLFSEEDIENSNRILCINKGYLDIGYDKNTGIEYVFIDPRYYRPAEVEELLGDPSKAKQQLGWEPEITVQEMCAEMVTEDLRIAQRHALLKASGHAIQVPLEEGR